MLNNIAPLLNFLYTDKMTVTRHIVPTETSYNADGSIKTNAATPAVYTDIPCRISTQAADTSDSLTQDKNPYTKRIVVFCSPEFTILKGDLIQAVRSINGRVISLYTGYAGDPDVYDINQQFQLVAEGNA